MRNSVVWLRPQLHYEAVLRIEPNYGVAIAQLTSVYRQRRMWGKALESRLNPYVIAQIKYLQDGDKASFIEALPSDVEVTVINRGNGGAARALISRDLKAALQLFEDTPLGTGVSLIGGLESFNFEPIPLLRALLWFELDNKEQWSAATDEARLLLERLLKDYPEGDPGYGSNLAICYALQGEQEPIDALVAKVRQKTSTPNWSPTRQQHCEMHISIAYLILGDHDKAIETLEAANKMDGPLFVNPRS